MLSYTVEEIKEIFETLLRKQFESVIAIGNHHLKRHLVYEINFIDQTKQILKLYYKSDRRCNELASLRLLANSLVLCPKVIQFGNLDDGTEWIILEHIKGNILQELLPKLTQYNKEFIFTQMGEQLGQLHAHTFDYFGPWDEDGNSLYQITDYTSRMIQNQQRIFNEIKMKSFPDQELLIKTILDIIKDIDLLNVDLIPRLTHHDYDGRNIIIQKLVDKYHLKGIIDFEICQPGNYEKDLVGLYFKYLLKNEPLEKAFLKGYTKHMELDASFKSRLPVYLKSHAVINCSWAYEQAPDYYEENIQFLKSL